jgi:hypothetical protein
MNIVKKNNLLFNKIIKNKININNTINKPININNTINKPNIKDNTINKPNIKDNTINKPNIKDNTINKPNIKDNIINKPNIKDNTINKPNIKDNTINKPNIKDNIIILTKDNINLFINDFKNITNIRIFGKGPSFKNIIPNSNDFHIAVNQAANELTNCDMLAINDLHNIYLIKDDVIKKIRYIITPEYLHINQYFNNNGHFSKVYNYILSKGFTGKYIVYNLKTNPNPNRTYISLYTSLTTSNTVAEFICTYLKNYIKLIEFYGVGVISNKNYSDKFKGNGTYDVKRINGIKKYINEVCKNNNINYEIY